MTAIMTPQTIATSTRALLIEELGNVEGNAEIINGRVVRMSPAKGRHSSAASNIIFSLGLHQRQKGGGRACSDGAGFLVDLPDRYSFSADAAWHNFKLPETGDEFFVGAPLFAAEVRSLSQYSPSGEAMILKKIKEYFAAGTLVVWDVDCIQEGWIKKYTPETLDNPVIFHRGDIADVEPAVPGWRMPVNELFVSLRRCILCAMSKIFLAAEWRHLAMLNYEVDPAILKSRIPAGTELDLWNGKAIVSLVGFMFLKTRVLGIPIPFHMNFEELNLRFYIKRPHPDGDRRAVAFVKEIVPRWAIAFVARTLYNENYYAVPMRHDIVQNPESISAKYEWKMNGHWQQLSVRCSGESAIPAKGSEAEFITEHYWGYAAQPGGGTMEYQVAHPQWRTWTADDFNFDADIDALYGNEFAPHLRGKPVSAILAEGSPITVSKGLKF